MTLDFQDNLDPHLCECEECCDGEHPGECRECAGWGECGGEPCAHCNHTGDCPKCHGAKRPADKDDPDAT